MNWFKMYFNAGPVSLVRRNHALEHATLHVLGEKNPRRTMAGYSDMRGFWILGQVSADELQEAVDEALKRLRQGEFTLAIQPNCGTNFAVSGLLAGCAAWLAMSGAKGGWREKLDRLPMTIMLTTLALILGAPLGPMLQANVTTLPYPGNLEVVGINIYERNRIPTYKVLTRA